MWGLLIHFPKSSSWVSNIFSALAPPLLPVLQAHICRMPCRHRHRCGPSSWGTGSNRPVWGKQSAWLMGRPRSAHVQPGNQSVPCTEPNARHGRSVWGQETMSHQHVSSFLWEHSPPIVSHRKPFSAPHKARACPPWAAAILILWAVGVIHTVSEWTPRPTHGSRSRQWRESTRGFFGVLWGSEKADLG